MEQSSRQGYTAYEYKKVTVQGAEVSWYLDCYEAFGWEADENVPFDPESGTTVLALKRDRKIINKAELTRLQRNFEACAREIGQLEHSKTSKAMIWAMTIGIIGTAFMAGSVFAVTHNPPIIWLCIVLAIPAFLGWILPYFVYRKLRAEQEQRIQPLIEEKQEEIYAICEKGNGLLQS